MEKIGQRDSKDNDVRWSYISMFNLNIICTKNINLREHKKIKYVHLYKINAGDSSSCTNNTSTTTMSTNYTTVHELSYHDS